ncbi:MAG: Gfo/Idh/MocA family oxidoreductase [Leptospiraceae bacterium]|nr:Gfo/Idh/MocA family oxidoreductase [Leptospiraceae bacterium]MCP5496253.1 Gfo/Idh/MocA family oxidoreductase [Leptospiraceae bacterium]
MKLGIIGCGLIGYKRADSIQTEDTILMCCDIQPELAGLFSKKYNCESTLDWKNVIANKDLDAVIIATTHNNLAEITLEAIKNKKHVLVEKPAARNSDELEPVANEYRKTLSADKIVVKVGFNHRFHPAMLKAKEIIDSREMGELMFIRGRYGHGGRIGYEKEWRAIPEISGGGELLDQGMHLIDLSRWYMGDFSKVHGIAKTYFWDMQVDDNAFMLLETERGQVAQLHVTWTEWKNLFSLEIYGKNAKLHIEGLGGSYGTERIAYYKMKPEMGPPETAIFEYPGADVSWKNEWLNFKNAVLQKEAVIGDILDGYEALKIVKAIYAGNTR